MGIFDFLRIKDGLLTTSYKNGQKKSEGTWKDGKENGLITTWFENGQKEFEITYKDGGKDGLETSWYENGQKRLEWTYRNGLLWVEKYWNEDGSVQE